MRGRNTLLCAGLTSLQRGEYRRMQKEQLGLNSTNRRTNLIWLVWPLWTWLFYWPRTFIDETDLTEQTEQTEIGQLNDEDIDNFFTDNWNKNRTKKTETDLNVFCRWAKTFSKTRTLENIYQSKNLTNF